MDTLNRAKLRDYANTAATLAESLSKDIQKNRKVSDNTIIALNDFVQAAMEVTSMVDFLNTDPKARIN